MITKLAAFGLAVLSFASVARAQQFEFASGNYSRDKYIYSDNDKDMIKVLRKGNMVRVVDVRNNLVYGFEIGRREEQLVNPKLLEHLRSLPQARVIGNLIEKLTISNVRVIAEGKIAADFILYLKTSSVFGTVESKLLIGAEAESKQCTIYSNRVVNGVFNQTNYKGTCLEYSVGTEVGVLSLKTGLNEELNRVVGLSSDLMFKFFSPFYSSQDSIYEVR